MTAGSEFSGTALWYRALGSTATGLRLAEAWASDEHPEGSYATEESTRAALVWRTHASEHGLLRIEVPEDRTPGAPPLWFVPVDEPRGHPASCSLVAYLGGDIPAGTVVSPHTFATLEVHSDSQLGTVRWLRDGHVVELYVARDHRRQNVGITLVHAAGAWHQASGWPGFLYADAATSPPDALAPVARRHPGRIRRG